MTDYRRTFRSKSKSGKKLFEYDFATRFQALKGGVYKKQN